VLGTVNTVHLYLLMSHAGAVLIGGVCQSLRLYPCFYFKNLIKPDMKQLVVIESSGYLRSVFHSIYKHLFFSFMKSVG